MVFSVYLPRKMTLSKKEGILNTVESNDPIFLTKNYSLLEVHENRI